MLTEEQRKALFMKISELSGDNEDIMNTLAELQQDDAERSNTSTAYTEADVQDKDGVRWEKKYNDMKTKYRERFFGAGTTEPEPEPEPEPEKKAQEITFDDLFEKE